MTPKFRDPERKIRDSRRKDKAVTLHRRAVRDAKYVPAEDVIQRAAGIH
ncbi:hypothetical protein [Streptomyces sp. NBC_01198]|nr:hypothetical protein OG702_32165 [Streptomyces sp. NBC_01198]